MSSRRPFPIIFLFMLFLAVPAFSQEQLNQVDNQGRKQGPWCKRDSLGVKQYEGTFRNGSPFGIFTYYYPEGSVKTISLFSDDGRLARSVSYFKNGNIMARGNYLETKKDSTWLFYSDNDTNPVSRENYRNGLLNGVSITYYPNGIISETIEYSEGIKNGKWEQFFTDGSPKVKGAFKNGENDGHFLLLFPNGKTMINGNYADGHQEGEWLFYDESGKLIRKEYYNHGKLVKLVP